MTPLMFAGFFTCLLFGSAARSMALTPSSSLRFEAVHVGQDVTLKCFYQDIDGVIFYWYKQPQGEKPQLMSEFLKHNRNGSLKGELKNDPRFNLETGRDKNHLKISKVQRSDSATYYCTSIHTYEYQFLEGIVVHVQDSGSTIQTVVNQSGPEMVQSGGSVTLNCSFQTGACDGEHSVYWFKDTRGPLPSLIYTHGGRNDQCERKPNTPTHTCVFNLSVKNLNASHVGTYYCAVASCGHILFGNGTQLDFQKNVNSLVQLKVLSGALVTSIILVVFLVYKLNKTKSCTCEGSDPPERSSVVSTPDADGYEDAENLHYAALNEMKVSRLRGEKDSSSHSVYATVKR